MASAVRPASVSWASSWACPRVSRTSEHREAEAEAGVGQAEVERFGPQPGPGGDEPGEVGGEGDRQVAGGLVQAHGQPAAVWSGQVDLHDHRGRPAQPLVDAEQDVGGDDPAPGGRPDDQQGHGQADQPAGDQDGFAAVAVGQSAGQEVGGRLGQPEGNDVGEDGRDRGQPEDLGSQQRQQAAFLADHAADQGVDPDQEGELGQVGPQPQPQATGAGRWPAGSRAGQGLAGGPLPVLGATVRDPEVLVAGAGQQAGGGHGPLAVATHHRDRPFGQLRR